jgi:hypothetical protein
MFSHSFYHQLPASVRVRSTLHKYLNQRTLALLMFIVLALLGTIGGKESQTKQPSFDKGTIGDLTIRHQDQGGCAGAPKKSSPIISWQSVATVVNNFKEAFNDPSLIDYANQQATGIPDSPKVPRLRDSNQDSICSKSASTQSRKSSSPAY